MAWCVGFFCLNWQLYRSLCYFSEDRFKTGVVQINGMRPVEPAVIQETVDKMRPFGKDTFDGYCPALDAVTFGKYGTVWFMSDLNM